MPGIVSAVPQTSNCTGHPAWLRAGGLTLLAWLVVGLIYHDTAASMVAIWLRSGTYAHGFLVLPISAYLVWRQRGHLAALSPRPQWLGLGVVAALSGAWLLGDVSQTQLVQQLALVAMIPAIAWTLLGTAVVRRVAFPLAFLVFAVPWGEAWNPVLQDITAFLSVRLLELSGIPVFQDGRLISIPAGDFRVAETCSGLRYLVASLALGALYAYLSYRSPWRRIAFLAAAAVVPVLANALRAYAVMLLGHLTDMGWGTGDEHVVLGRVFFVAVMILLFWVGSFWWQRQAEPPSRPRSDASSAPGALTALPVLVIAVAAAGPALAAFGPPSGPGPATRVSLPEPGPGWTRGGDPEGDWQPRFIGADSLRLAAYRRAGGSKSVALMVAHYRRERPGAELVNAQNRVATGDWRLQGDASARSVTVAGDTALAFRELRFARNDGRRRLVWSWYDVGGRRLVTPAWAKAWIAIHGITGGPADNTLLALATDYGMRAETARQRLRAFLKAHPELAPARGVVRPALGARP